MENDVIAALRGESLIILLSFLAALTIYSTCSADTIPVNVDSSKKAALLAKVKKLEEAKAAINKSLEAKRDSMGRPAVIDSFNRDFDTQLKPLFLVEFENAVARGNVHRSKEFADTLFLLASFYYEMELKGSINQTAYSKSRKVFNHAKLIAEKLVKEYPDYWSLCAAYRMLKIMYQFEGQMDFVESTGMYLSKNCPHSDCYTDHPTFIPYRTLTIRDKVALMEKHFDCNHLDSLTTEKIHFRKAEIYFDIGDTATARNLFELYITMCRENRYPKTERYESAVKQLDAIKNGLSSIDRYER